MSQKNIHIIGSASGVGANQQGCSLGPIVLQTSPALTQLDFNWVWEPMLYVKQTGLQLAAMPAIAQLCDQIADHTYNFTQQQQAFVVLGGDHSCAVGTWSGVAAAVAKRGPLGLIWIDAHMDSHTPETSLTHNIHGMPLASLLGHGNTALTQLFMPTNKLQPEHVCLVGVRSFEADEAELLQRLKVRIFFIDEVKQKGIKQVMQEAVALVSGNTVGYGLSIDLDAIDPHDAPGVSVPAPDGISGEEFCVALHQACKQNSQLLGVEIVEFNPNLDQNNKTEQLVGKIVQSIFGD